MLCQKDPFRLALILLIPVICESQEQRLIIPVFSQSPIYSAFRPFRAAEEKAMGMDGSVRTHNPLEK